MMISAAYSMLFVWSCRQRVALTWIKGATGHDPARVLMTVSPPGHENYFEELAKAVSRDSAPDPKAIAELRRRYDTDQLSALKN